MKQTDMLPGISAERWARFIWPLCLVMFAVTFVAAVVYFGLGLTSVTLPWWFFVIILVVVSSLILAVFVILATLLKAIHESKAGYTTTGGYYPDLPQLDSKTGEVIREGAKKGC